MLRRRTCLQRRTSHFLLFPPPHPKKVFLLINRLYGHIHNIVQWTDTEARGKQTYKTKDQKVTVKWLKEDTENSK